MGDYTTPLDREILTHYYTSPAPFPRGTSACTDTIQKFLDMGLLVELEKQNEYGAIYAANFDALKVYMEALAAVPLPVQRWVVPDPTEGG